MTKNKAFRMNPTSGEPMEDSDEDLDAFVAQACARLSEDHLRLVCIHECAHQVIAEHFGAEGIVTIKRNPADRAHDRRPINVRLRSAIEAACGEVSARKLGKIFAKWEGLDIAGLKIDAVGADSDGILWRVSAAKLIRDRTPPANSGIVDALPPLRAESK